MGKTRKEANADNFKEIFVICFERTWKAQNTSISVAGIGA